jgi:hypothetical protein
VTVRRHAQPQRNTALEMLQGASRIDLCRLRVSPLQHFHWFAGMS